MTVNVHSTAVIDKNAKLEDGVTIGPFCVIGADVTLKAGVNLISSVTVMGETVIGENTVVYPYAVLGGPCQHTKFMNTPSKLFIGKNNVIREHVTMHVGTPIGHDETKVGDNGFFMVGSHIAHDCIVGNNVVMTNNAAIAGHVVIEDGAILGGFAAVHQFCRIGKFAMIGGLTGVGNDVIPYGLVTGDRGHLRGLNLVGLKRHDFSNDEIRKMQKAYDMMFFGEDTFLDRVEKTAEAFKGFTPIDDIIAFVKADTQRMICQPEHNA